MTSIIRFMVEIVYPQKHNLIIHCLAVNAILSIKVYCSRSKSKFLELNIFLSYLPNGFQGFLERAVFKNTFFKAI